MAGEQDIVVLTGAGVSKESGLDTFRDADGIWARVSIEDVATPEAFARDADAVHGFYNSRRQRLATGGIEPNAAHRALARLEAEWPGRVLVVTQNIDDLHERAGTENLIHMHGELLRARCGACADVVAWTGDLGTGDACGRCRARGRMRPHVVWFGEMPFLMDEIYEALGQCALFVSIGTSGNVYPASGFVETVRLSGAAHTAELNLEPSQRASRFAEAHYGPATDVVPAYVDKILSGGW